MPRSTYQPDPATPGGWIARFGLNTVMLFPRTGVRDIYRDGAKVGEWPEYGYQVRVIGDCSGSAPDLESAKAYGEYLARRNQPNTFTAGSGRHTQTREAACVAYARERLDHDKLMAAHPFTAAEVARLKASRHHADILEPPTPQAVARRVTELMGG